MICVAIERKGEHPAIIVPFSFVTKEDTLLSKAAPISELDSVDKVKQGGGRALLFSEINKSEVELECELRSRKSALIRAVEFRKKRPFCVRCGNEDVRQFAEYKCSWCERVNCLYCRQCIMMGKVTSCTPLWVETDTTVHVPQNLIWEGVLTPMQEKAASRMVKALERTGNEYEQLIWAVCGAGKTEMLFPALIEAIARQFKVLIATPRTDVVLELLPRLKRAFPTVKIAGLYGGSEERYKDAQLYISTTHQTRRFMNYFDLIIVDEVDAFPYSYDQSLAYAVNKSAKIDANIFYLSATPKPQLVKRMQKTDSIVKVKRRFHGFPLPVPQFCWVGNWRNNHKKKQLAPVFAEWIENQERNGRRALIFVPSIKTAFELSSLMNRSDTKFVHSKEPERKQIVNDFREGKFTFLITTTILERGVTIPKIDVCILGAEDDIFTTAALVQIAGRAGRSADDPDGKVTYFHYGTTLAMKNARSQIKEMNKP